MGLRFGGFGDSTSGDGTSGDGTSGDGAVGDGPVGQRPVRKPPVRKRAAAPGGHVRRLDDGLVAEWERLALASAAPPFLRPGWLLAWAEAFGLREALRVLTVERDGALVGLLPLLARAGTLRSATNGETALYAPIAADREAATALGARLLTVRTGMIDLTALPADSPPAGGIEDAVAQAAAPVLRRSLRLSPYVDVTGDPAGFPKRLSKNRRSSLNRLQNRLRDLGELSLDVRDGAGDLGALLDEGYRLEAREWKLAQRTAILSHPETTAFYTAAARWAAAEGILRLAYLRLDGRAIGFGYCLQAGGTLYFLKLGMDDSFAKLGPGVVLTRHLIDYAFAAPDVTELDLLGENEQYKMDFASGTHEQIRLQIFPNRVLGPAARAAVASAAELRRSLVARLPEPAKERLIALRGRLRR